MDKILSETTNFCVEIMNSKRQVKGKLGRHRESGDHETRSRQSVLFVSSPNKRQGRTDQFPFYLYSLQFFLVENAGQSSFPPNQTVDLQKEQDSISAVHKVRRYRKLDP